MDIPNIDLYHLLKPAAIIEYESSINQQSRRELEALIFAQNKGDTQSNEEYYKSLLHELEAALKQTKKKDVFKYEDGTRELATSQEGKPIAIFSYDRKLLPNLKKIIYFRSGMPTLSIYFNSSNWRDYTSIDRVVEGEAVDYYQMIKNYKKIEMGREESKRWKEESEKFDKEMEKYRKDFERRRKQLEERGVILPQED